MPLSLAKSVAASDPVLRELKIWRFTRSLENVFSDVGDGLKYHNREKTLAEARNLLDRWLLSFQIDYSDSMDTDFPIFPRELRRSDSVNVKLIDECREKKFSLSEDNATEIFDCLSSEIEAFKRNYNESGIKTGAHVKYFKNDEDSNAQLTVGDFKTSVCNRVVFLVENFGLLASARMLLRYESLGTGSLQWGDPITVHNALYRQMGVRYEGFASPLNSKMLGKKDAQFCSLFFDTDEAFGSIGNFFSVDFSKHPGGWTVNPPFIESLMERVAKRVIRRVSECRRSENWYFVTFPRWPDSPGWELLDKFEHKIDQIELSSGEFTVQCCYGKVFPPRNDLTIFVVGRRLPDGACIDTIRSIFKDTDTDYIRKVWLDNCQIRMNNCAEGESEWAKVNTVDIPRYVPPWRRRQQQLQ